MRHITLAAAQMTCQDGQVQANLGHASELAQQAQVQGAQLILFPEFMPQGYLLTSALWDSAEPFDGPTTRWLAETARRLGVFIGASFLEARLGDFLNTFALADPAGKIAGAVRKRNPSMWEAYFFKGERGAPYIDSELGRIGVGICFDNHTYEVASAVAASNIDLMLMPHSYCTPTIPTKMTSQADIDRLNGLPVRVARFYNEWFGVPVLLDADGTLCGQLGDEEAVLTGTVALDPALKKHLQPPKYSRYIYPGSLGREIIRLMEWRGRRSHTASALRKQKALQQAAAVLPRSSGWLIEHEQKMVH